MRVPCALPHLTPTPAAPPHAAAPLAAHTPALTPPATAASGTSMRARAMPSEPRLALSPAPLAAHAPVFDPAAHAAGPSGLLGCGDAHLLAGEYGVGDFSTPRGDAGDSDANRECDAVEEEEKHEAEAGEAEGVGEAGDAGEAEGGQEKGAEAECGNEMECFQAEGEAGEKGCTGEGVAGERDDGEEGEKEPHNSFGGSAKRRTGWFFGDTGLCASCGLPRVAFSCGRARSGRLSHSCVLAAAPPSAARFAPGANAVAALGLAAGAS
ncbi:unnamed protein product [Closterium sp. Yama58-4]|nr:unnamed protein product [Closterium sp. Yama58-4]